ncbi:MAG: hypothetical protein JKX80_03005, partial [Candidatus Pacebacteria bacterium]|nr:hypothetical protein [Candidatus Paceibacterota bacterium]
MEMKRIAMIHYDEIALKGANRKIFEQSLVNNIAYKIKRAKLSYTVVNRWGRIVVVPKDGSEWDSDSNASLQTILATTPG